MMGIELDVDFMQTVAQFFVFACTFGFFVGTVLHLLSYGIFKAFRFVNIKL